MAKNYFKRYIWLIELLQSYSMLTLDEIKYYWLHSSVNEDGKALADRTFFNTVDSILDMFGISIVCNRSSNEYYIENGEDVMGVGIRNWMMNALSLNNILTESASMKDRIIFEDIPSSQMFLIPIVKAMKEGTKIHVKYRSFAKDSTDERYLEPYCVKSYKQRWYLLAAYEGNPEPHVYALDRMQEVRQGHAEFSVPEDFCAEEYFRPYCGYPTGNERYGFPVDVKVKVDDRQRKYFRTLPLHGSQKEVENCADHSVFGYHLVPNFHFKKELFSYMDAVEVLEPVWLREEMKETIKRITNTYFPLSIRHPEE